MPIAYFHRYYRLTPLLAFIMYFVAFVMYPLASGPARGFSDHMTENCAKYGWKNILYINNYETDSLKGCMGQTWYLANDMQMFLILPWFMLCYLWKKPVAWIILACLFIANLVVSFYVAYHYDLGTYIVSPFDVSFKLVNSRTPPSKQI